MFVRGLTFTAVLLMLGVAGCGGGGASTVAISGKVTWDDGSPVEGAMVKFTPADQKKEGAREASGLSSADGSFSLTTFNSGDGALLGDYVVLVTKVKAVDVGGGDPGQIDPTKAYKKYLEKKGIGTKTAEKSDIPAIYSSPKTSPLKAKVEGARSDLVFKLNKPKS